MKKLLLLILSFCALSLFCQTDTDTNRIDSTLLQCLDSSQNQSTQGMIQCTLKAIDQWDKEMNAYYKLLMGKLKPAEKAKLKAAQKKWLDYRNSEMEFSSLVCENLQGTMFQLVNVNRLLNIVKTRAVELKEYYNLITMN